MSEISLLQKGDVILERYVIDSLIGQGGIGRTFLANDNQTQISVVLKILSLSELKDWKALELFEREIDVLKNLDYPLIRQYYNSFQTEIKKETIFVLVQEYIKGKNLSEIINEGRHFSLSEVRDIFKSLLETLIYMHRLNPPIIHRDITPKNVILSEENQVYLVDFGAVGRIIENTYTAAMSNTFVGTIGYMPPEQLFGKSSPASDLYSLAATVIFLLTGKNPSEFELDNLKIDFSKYTHLPMDFKNLLDRLIEPDDKKRLSNAKQVLNLLNDIIVVKDKSNENKTKKKSEYKNVDKEQKNVITTAAGDESDRLFKAVSARDIEYIKRLIEEDSDVNMKDAKTGLTPLHVTAKENYARIAEILVESGADMNKKDKRGKTPFIVAVENKNLSIAEYFLKKGSNINAFYQSRTLLHNMVINGDIQAVKFLAAHGADVNLEDEKGKTVLEYAYDKNRKDIEDFLIENGAIVNSKTYGGALINNALKTKDIPYLGKLIKEGAPVNIKMNNGLTPIEMAVFNKPSLESAGLLIRNKANVNIITNNGNPLLIEAVEGKKIDFVKLLIENGANIDNPGKNGNTALHTAVQKKDKAITELLLNSKADANIKNNTGKTPLKIAFDNHDKDLVRILIENNANVDEKFNGKSFLHMAVEDNDVEMVKIFLSGEAFADIKDKSSGKTPLQVAYEHNFSEIVRILIEYGANDDFEFSITNKFKDISSHPRKISFLNTIKIILLPVSNRKNVSKIYLFIAGILFFFHAFIGYKWLGVIRILNAKSQTVAYPLHYSVTSFGGGSKAKYKVIYAFTLNNGNLYTGYSYLPYTEYKKYFGSQRNGTKEQLVVTFVKDNPAISMIKDSWFTPFGNYFPLILIFFLLFTFISIIRIYFIKFHKNHCAYKLFKRGKIADGKITHYKKIDHYLYHYYFEFFDFKKQKNTGHIIAPEKYAHKDSIIPVLYLPSKPNKYLVPDTLFIDKLKVIDNNWKFNFKFSKIKSAFLSYIMFFLSLFFTVNYSSELISQTITGYFVNTINDSQNRTIIMKTIMDKKHALAKMFINNKIGLNRKDNQGQTALMYATQHYNVELISLLIKNGENINEQSKDGKTCLFFAIKLNNLYAVKQLLENGANINVKENLGFSPLLFSLYNKFDKIAEYLISKGADVNAGNKEGITPLMFAANMNVDIVRLLIKKGADINAVSNTHKNSLMFALENRGYWYYNEKIIRFLVDSGINVNIQDQFGMTPLMYSAKSSQRYISLLIGKVKNINAKDVSGKTTLMHASSSRYDFFALWELLKHQTSINEKDNEGKTALIHAVIAENHRAVRLLLEYNADKTIKDNNGDNALMIAERMNYQIIVNLLKTISGRINARRERLFSYSFK